MPHEDFNVFQQKKLRCSPQGKYHISIASGKSKNEKKTKLASEVALYHSTASSMVLEKYTVSDVKYYLQLNV